MEPGFITIIAGVTAIIASLLSHWLSAHRLNEEQKILKRLIEFHKKNSENHRIISDDEFFKSKENLNVTVLDSPIKIERHTYRRLQSIQFIGRASSLRRRSSLYKKLWIFVNSGLVNSVINISNESEENNNIDKNTIIGMLVGDRIKKDTKSYIYLSISLIASIFIPIIADFNLNLWLIGFLLIIISLLTLNHKILEYRIVKGYYGSNEYEAREIISYLESHTDPDDFNGSGKKKVFQSSLPQNEVEILDLIEGLTS